MFSSIIKNPEIYKYLNEIGCCEICCIRFCKGRAIDYLNIEKTFNWRSITKEQNNIVENDTKRLKRNCCIACLGLLEEENMANVLQEIVQHPDLATYDCETVLTSISLPLLLNLRQLSIWIGLIKTFPGIFSLDESPDFPLKEVVKLLLNPKVCEKIGKAFEQNQNGMMINVFFEHEDEAAELKSLGNVNPKLFQERLSAPRKFHREFMTRNAFEKNFIPSKIDIETFLKHVSISKNLSTTPIKLEKITILGPTIFVAGRYRKLSRELSQSPWVLQGKRVMEDSVQEIIAEKISPYFGVPTKNIIFSSSGREDVDVRCLGKGRPFVFEIPDSHKYMLPHRIAAEMEIAVDKSEKVSIQHLQIVKREDLIHIKTGEESKKKIYRALCVLKEPASVELMKKLDIPDGFTIEQITPLRVLHRRPLHNRSRRIFSVKGFVDKNNHKIIIMDIVTQAGTYVKELIHGEFGRTSPSISSIIEQWIDIMSLDVVAIDLDWPMEIDNKNHVE